MRNLRLASAMIILGATIAGVIGIVSPAQATECYLYLECVEDCFFTWVEMDDECETLQCIKDALTWWLEYYIGCLPHPPCPI